MKPETILQARIVNALRKFGFWVIVTQVTGKRSSRSVKTGEPGQPDLLILGHGWVGFGETKVPGGKLSDAQIEWHAKAQDRGQNVAVWTCPADAIRSCELWRRKAAAA